MVHFQNTSVTKSVTYSMCLPNDAVGGALGQNIARDQLDIQNQVII